MNEVEKLYKNAGVKKQYDYIVIKKNYNGKIRCTKRAVLEKVEQFKNKTLRIIEVCPFYPDFTAEKQLELIKLLSYYYNITVSKNFENDYTFQCEGDDVRRYVFTSGQDFAEQIASFVNMCYELLPKEERKQIADILRG